MSFGRRFDKKLKPLYLEPISKIIAMHISPAIAWLGRPTAFGYDSPLGLAVSVYGGTFASSSRTNAVCLVTPLFLR